MDSPRPRSARCPGQTGGRAWWIRASSAAQREETRRELERADRREKGDRALPLLRSLVDRNRDVPAWMWSWSAYLLAEQIAGESPGRARALLERVLAEGIDESGLFGELRALLRALERDGPRWPGRGAR